MPHTGIGHTDIHLCQSSMQFILSMDRPRLFLWGGEAQVREGTVAQGDIYIDWYARTIVGSFIQNGKLVNGIEE